LSYDTEMNIYRYVSYRRFLDDWFRARKRSNPRYSHRLFARRAGIRSPSLLGEVIAGRRNLSPTTVEGFISALELRTGEASFFADLVRFDQATSAARKNKAWERIAASRRFRSARPLDAGMMRYLSNWYIPAVRELAWCPGFMAEPRWISEALRPRITVAQARDALETLHALGMLVEDDDGIRPAETSVATPHQLADLGANNYHRQMLGRAADAIETVEPDERHLCAVTVAIPVALLPTLKAELDAFQERLLHLCDARISEAEQVVQINLTMVPLSQAQLSQEGPRSGDAS